MGNVINYEHRYHPGQDAILDAGFGPVAFYTIHAWMLLILAIGAIGGVQMLYKGTKQLRQSKVKGAAATSKRMPLYMAVGTTTHALFHSLDHWTMIVTAKFPVRWLAQLEGCLFCVGALLFAFTVLFGCIYWVWFFSAKTIPEIMRRQTQNLWGKNDWKLKALIATSISAVIILFFAFNGFGAMSPYIMLLSSPYMAVMMTALFYCLFLATLQLYFMLFSRMKRQTDNINQSKDTGKALVAAQIQMARKLSRYLIALCIFFCAGAICMTGLCLALIYGDPMVKLSTILFVLTGTWVNAIPMMVPYIWRYNQREADFGKSARSPNSSQAGTTATSMSSMRGSRLPSLLRLRGSTMTGGRKASASVPAIVEEEEVPSTKSSSSKTITNSV